MTWNTGPERAVDAIPGRAPDSERALGPGRVLDPGRPVPREAIASELGCPG